jgi:hypothetical protein
MKKKNNVQKKNDKKAGRAEQLIRPDSQSTLISSSNLYCRPVNSGVGQL